MFELYGALLGGTFTVDVEDKCIACIVFRKQGGKCLKVTDLDDILVEAERIVKQIFYPVLQFLFDALDYLIQNTLGQFIPEIHLPLPELDFPELGELDGLIKKLDTQFRDFDIEIGNVLHEMQQSLVGAKILPDGFDLPCNLGPEFLARFESMIGVGVDVEEVGVAAAVLAIRARGPSLPKLSPSDILASGIKSGALAPHMRSVLPISILPAIVKRIGASGENNALDATNNRRRVSYSAKPKKFYAKPKQSV